MKKGPRKTPRKKAQREYDFKGGVRGKYAPRYAEGSNVVLLSPDVAQVSRFNFRQSSVTGFCRDDA